MRTDVCHDRCCSHSPDLCVCPNPFTFELFLLLCPMMCLPTSTCLQQLMSTYVSACLCLCLCLRLRLRLRLCECLCLWLFQWEWECPCPTMRVYRGGNQAQEHKISGCSVLFACFHTSLLPPNSSPLVLQSSSTITDGHALNVDKGYYYKKVPLPLPLLF